MRARPLASLALALLGSAGCGDRVLDEPPAPARLVVDLSALQATHPATSVLDRVSLSWGAADSLLRPYAGLDTIPFSVTVPRSGATFVASVWSNNGTRLYAATTQYTPDADGFRRTIAVNAINAVMIVTPDTIDLRTAQSVGVVIRNAGSQQLVWTVQPPCTTSSCIRLSRNAGVVAAGRSDTIAVSGSAAASANIPLRFDANVGFVMLTTRLGGDAIAPLISIAGIADSSTNSQLRGWTVSYADEGTPSSGFDADPVRLRLRRVRPAGESCFVPNTPFTATTTPCPQSSAGYAPDDGQVTLPSDSIILPGYWELSAFVVDRAGNASATAARLALFDVVPPTIFSLTTPTVITGNTTANFSAIASDNVELGTWRAAVEYGGGRVFHQPGGTSGRYGPGDGIRGQDTMRLTIPGFLRAWEGTDSLHRATGPVNEALTVSFSARDVAGNSRGAAASINGAVRAGAGSAGAPVPSLRTVSPALFAPSDPSHGRFTLTAPAPAVLCRATAGCSNPASTTLRAGMTTSLTATNPFQRVEWYYADPVTEQWVPIGSTANASVTTGVTTRVWTYVFAWNVTGITGPTGAPLLGTVPVVAVGVHSSGSALISTSTQAAVTIAGS